MPKQFPLGRLDKPCASCPWRKDQDASDIPNFDLERAERLSECCPDERGFGPDFNAKLFACHQSKEGREFACAGWLAAVGDRHPMVRLSIALDRLSADALRPGEGWPELHEDYGQVLEKLRLTSQG